MEKADEDVDILGSDEPLSAVTAEHQLMTELSDLPPDQLLDGGSEDMEMVCFHGGRDVVLKVFFPPSVQSDVDELDQGEWM